MYNQNQLSIMSKEDLIQIILNLQTNNNILYFYKTLKNSNEIAISIVVTKVNFKLKINYEIKMNIYFGEIERVDTLEINLNERQIKEITQFGYTNETILDLIEDKCEMQFFPYRNKTSKITYQSSLDNID